MPLEPAPFSERSFARCGHLRLTHVRVDGVGLGVEARHQAPHLGYVLHGSFAIRIAASERWFAAGELRFSPHVESLQLDMPAGFEAIVGELEDVPPLSPSEASWMPGDATVRRLFESIAADSTHPALVDIERWMLLERSRALPARRRAQWIDDLIREWKEAPLGSRAVRQWSDQAGRHRSTLHRSFRQSVGMDPSGWLLRERLRRAWRSLETEQPLVEIALDCGFADQSHMNRVFRRLTGWTPGALRGARLRGQASDATRIQDQPLQLT